MFITSSTFFTFLFSPSDFKAPLVSTTSPIPHSRTPTTHKVPLALAPNKPLASLHALIVKFPLSLYATFLPPLSFFLSSCLSFVHLEHTLFNIPLLYFNGIFSFTLTLNWIAESAKCNRRNRVCWLVWNEHVGELHHQEGWFHPLRSVYLLLFPSSPSSLPLHLHD